MSYRRLPTWLTRAMHVAYGFILAKAAATNPLIATLMFVAFSIYEFSEWI